MNSCDKKPEVYWKSIPEEPRNALINSIRNSYNGKSQQQRDEAIHSCGMTAQTIIIAAKSMRYDTCHMKCFDYDAVGKMIKVPVDHVTSMMVVVG